MRFFQITLVLLKYFVFYPLTPHRRQIMGRRLKLAFGELGLTFIKIGQILSMRYDLLSRRDCEALQELLDNVNPIAFADIITLIEKEYGKPWHQVFAILYAEPLGSASVSQVHKAELFNGTKVAIKIKRPGVDRQFLADIRILKKLATIASFFFRTLRHVQISELINYFEGWIKQDLDFVLEAKNMRRVKEQYNFGDEKSFRHDLGKGIFIAPFEELCTKNIIVMDFVDGIPMSRKEEILANPDFDIEKSLKTYMNAAMRNWFREDTEVYLFQADPHLSNVLALPHGDAANIDCGLVSELSKKEADICKHLIVAVYMQDINQTIKIVTEMTGINYQKYAEELRPDLKDYLEKTKGEGFGFWFLEVVKILVKHKIKFPLFLTTFGRTNLVLDGLMDTYIPEQTTIDIVGKELKRYAIKQTFDNLLEFDWLRIAYSVSEKIKEAPELATNLLEDPLGVLSKIAAAAKTAA